MSKLENRPTEPVAIMRPKEHSCMCELCADHQIEKFAELMACGCTCHQDGYAGHDGLCCQVPNVLPENHIEIVTEAIDNL